MLQVYCGDGKGKTTAALGQALRGAGSGMNVLIWQFLKGNSSNEYHSLKHIPNINIYSVTDDVKFSIQMSEKDLSNYSKEVNKSIQKIYSHCINDNLGMLVLDEILGAIEIGVIEEHIIIDLINQFNDKMEIVLTGRMITDKLLDMADYVSQINKIKHPYDKKISARKGIEF